MEMLVGILFESDSNGSYLACDGTVYTNGISTGPLWLLGLSKGSFLSFEILFLCFELCFLCNSLKFLSETNNLPVPCKTVTK